MDPLSLAHLRRGDGNQVMTAEPITALIVDDEPPARRRLQSLIQEEGDLLVIGEAQDGREAVDLIVSLKPDLVFLDVQMPELDGFGVIREVGTDCMPAVVFVTAFDEFAVRAFDVAAVDYLMKPFDRPRFQAAVARVRGQLRGRPDATVDERLVALLRELHGGAADYITRMAIRHDGRIRFLNISDVDYILAEGNYVRLVAGKSSHLIRDTLTRLEERLDPRKFLRIHRSTMVQLDRIVSLEPMFQGEYMIVLRDGVRLRSGRRFRDRLQQALGLDQ
jgi:two-component system, LytTR family, response regulator